MDILTQDRELKFQLNSLASHDQGYWSFRYRSERDGAHNYFQYPAMMIPRMLRDLIRCVIEADHKVRTIFDPFAGSGTVLAEAMLQGKNFVGADINPLAVLLCKTKSGPFHPDLLEDRIDELIASIDEDTSSGREADFPGIHKWFEPHILVELSRIRRAIRAEPILWCRRFFWVAFAGTVRLSSNSRTSTFKLHIRPAKDIVARRHLSPTAIFNDILNRNFESYCEQSIVLEHLGLVWHGHYLGNVRCAIRDARRTKHFSTKCDLLITSPPYGDNGTTVPYGQSSYLPLNWIDLEDIDRAVDPNMLNTTHEIDHRSLGGDKQDALDETRELLQLTPSLARTLRALSRQPRDRQVRIAAFFRDLNCTIEPTLRALRRGAYAIWVIGNRTVGGLQIPANRILSELLIDSGCKPITMFHRNIGSKRMALKNNVSTTMRKEAILIFRKT